MKHIHTGVLGGDPMFAQEKNSKKTALTILLKICTNIKESDMFTQKTWGTINRICTGVFGGPW